MIATALRQWVTATALIALAAFPGASTAGAADASTWDGDARSAMRLVAGSPAGRGAMRAGVELRLGAGWKTYWRYPGDSGVPPRFDFSKSTNVKSVTVQWPAPHRFTDESGASIGYKGGVLLPLDVVAANPTRPVTLRVVVDYAICEKLCIPAKGSAALGLGAASAFDAALAAAQAQVPKPAALGDSAALAIRSVKREPGSPNPRVIVEVAAPERRRSTCSWRGRPTIGRCPCPSRWREARPDDVAIRSSSTALPPGATAIGATLRFTLVSGDKAIEVTTVLE